MMRLFNVSVSEQRNQGTKFGLKHGNMLLLAGLDGKLSPLNDLFLHFFF